MQTPSCRTHLRLAALVALCIGPDVALAADDDSQRKQLATLIRQLDLLERQADYAAALPAEEHTRYHFDYARLHEDIAQIRTGITDYLTPPRAQPRDLVPLSGDYRREPSTGAVTP